MNCTQMQFHCGIGSSITIDLCSGNQIKGTLVSVSQHGIEIQTEIGAARLLKNEEIMDIQSEGIAHLFTSPEIQKKVRQFHGKANELVNSGLLSLPGILKRSVSSAVEELTKYHETETNELIKILQETDEIKKKLLSRQIVQGCIHTVKKYLSKNQDLCRWICFLLWYGADCSAEAMAILTGDLTLNGEFRTDQLNCHLGDANQLIGKMDAMTVYWLGKYFKEQPEQALEDNELCCSTLWLTYLDMCSDLLYFEGIANILITLSQSMSDESYCCACCSLFRLFSRSGRHSLAREAAACLIKDSNFAQYTRTVKELTVYLNSDKDCHCFFAAKAADMILQDNKEKGIRQYIGDADITRCGYLYNFTSTKHFGHILGYDLMTYFLPSSSISEKRRKEIKKGFDLSQYHGNRTLMAQFVFLAEKSFRRGNSYVVTELL